MQLEAMFNHWMVSNIALAFHEPKKLPSTPREAFPQLFDEIEESEESQWDRFIEGAHKINKKRGDK